MVQKYHGILGLGNLCKVGHIPRSLEEEATDHLQISGVEIRTMEYNFQDLSDLLKHEEQSLGEL